MANAAVGSVSLLALYFYFFGEKAALAPTEPYDFPNGLDEYYAPIGNFFVTHRPITIVFTWAASLIKKYNLRHQLGPMGFLIHEAYERAALNLREKGHEPDFPELAKLATKLEESEKLEGQKLYNKLVSSLLLNAENDQVIINIIIIADRVGILYNLCVDENNSNKSPVEIITEHLDEIIQQLNLDKRD